MIANATMIANLMDIVKSMAPGKTSASTLGSIALLLVCLFVGRRLWIFILLGVAASRWAAASWKAWRSPLSQLPGPWYAPFTNIHLQYLFSRGTVPQYIDAAHARYGPVMRLGPCQVWISDKAAMKEILSTVDLPKVAMYAEISREKESAGLFGEVYVSLLPSQRQCPRERLQELTSLPLVDDQQSTPNSRKCSRHPLPWVSATSLTRCSKSL
jgi:hypothetical protein